MTNLVCKLVSPFIKSIELVAHHYAFVVADSLFLKKIVEIVENLCNLLPRFGLFTLNLRESFVDLLHERLQQRRNIVK